MSKVVIMTDSTCVLPKELIEEKGIVIVPISINFDGKVYQDYYKVNAKGLYDAYAKRGGAKPTSSPASQLEFTKYFEENLKDDAEILYIGASANISGCVANANMAMGMMMTDKVVIVDSKSVSSGLGFIVLKACELRDGGATARAIATQLKDVIKNTNVVVGVNEIETVTQTGRCQIKKSLFGPKKAVLAMKNGVLEFLSGQKGKGNDMLDELVDTVKKDAKDIEGVVYVTSVAAPDSSKYVKEKLETLGCKQVIEISASAAFACSIGQGGVVVSYLKK